MPRRMMIFFLLLAWSAAPCDAGENANLAAAELLHGAAPAISDTLQARFPGDYAALLPQAAALAMLPGTGAPAAVPQAQTQALIDHTVAAIEQRDGDLVIRAPTASLRLLIGADHDLLAAARDADAPICPALLTGRAIDWPAGPIALAHAARTAALLAAIADGRDHPVTARRANPDDYKALTQVARSNGINVAGWTVLAPTNLVTAPAAEVCAAMVSVDTTVLALQDDLADRLMADMAAVLVRQGS